MFPVYAVLGADRAQEEMASGRAVPAHPDRCSVLPRRAMGDLFLGHIERCAVLLHLVDGTSQTIAEDYHTIIDELSAYGAGLAEKPRITVLNKIDTLDEEERVEACKELETASGGPVMMMSGVSRDGVTEVLRKLRSQIDDDRLRHKPVEDEEPWHP